MMKGIIESLRKEITAYASHVTEMMDKCTKGLMEKDEALLSHVTGEMEERANTWEMELEELAAGQIAQYQPRAKDLRTILMIFKMTNDLERIADHAVNMAQSAKYLIHHPQVKPMIDIPSMAEHTKTMLKDSIRSFIEENSSLAESVCKSDSKVDSYRDQIYRELITYMTSDPTTIERSLHLMRYSRNLERIADLATNICEDAVFIATGRVIKHHKAENCPIT